MILRITEIVKDVLGVEPIKSYERVRRDEIMV